MIVYNKMNSDYKKKQIYTQCKKGHSRVYHEVLHKVQYNTIQYFTRNLPLGLFRPNYNFEITYIVNHLFTNVSDS